MRDDLKALLRLVSAISERARETRVECDELRHQIETTKEIIRKTRQLIIASDSAIERLRFVPISYPLPEGITALEQVSNGHAYLVESKEGRIGTNESRNDA